MEDRILIYVAGNPDAYPLEYYDSASESYQGVIPRLLEDFSAQSSFEVVYYQTEGADRRDHLADYLQVDLLSGYTQGDEFPNGTQEILLFPALIQGQEQSYYLCSTRAAPQELVTQLEAFLASVSPQTITGLLLETTAAQTPTSFSPLPLALGGAVLAALLMAAGAALAVRHYRKRIHRIQQDLEGDEATGLGNFDYLQRYYLQMVNDRNRVLYSLVYFYVDTDYLHRMASSQEADEVLRFCAVVLQEQAADTDILAKVSRHGFALLKLSGNPEQLKTWIATVLHKIRAYPQTYAKSLEVRIAAGVYPLKMGDRDLNEMIFNASQEARSALNQQEDCSIFSDESRKRIQMEQKLRATVERAMERREFQLHIQFYVDSATHQIVGGEALSRWVHPDQGLLPPSVFVPVLEREGLIHRLDYHCLRSACLFLQELFDRGIQTFFLSCNFSRDTFASTDFVPCCRAIIDSFRFPRELLIFELTESTSVKHLAQIKANMAALKRCGIRIALDDFGEGFTSFSDLQEYPVDGIKLDKRLVDNALTKTGQAILRAMIQAGHELDLTILAEGVETASQAQVLRALHCDVIQGFQFFAPIPEAEARERLLSQVYDPALP